ncbi:PSD1 and planctomycete cytochrome C domain-containing protein [Flavitalea sp. BT771]|uniref:PSD1 and planctomycete cytochrome C domain-containing protein n=1 Tax=Flavitalea sp. BT771 TaxID=3063329 RepID=UPI0026E280C0|nr:PSD1 and planctomycete cytochrome C domain-containing protein [Flavitalea sp. BT771]MDO6432196.1 PSD1 and planctomycete cytochrome C domain-containing protein [Flavitalea sp. BT771]MDV6221106.1 PSD1 and planctomycete cytochrome C domain-containing protein [Flavitalea sp. BT771]
MNKRLYILIVLGTGFFLYILHLNSCSSSVRGIDDQVPGTISYDFNIRPILSDKCYKCHGPDSTQRAAGLRLDIPEEAYKALKDNPNAHALVPGRVDLSELFKRVSTEDTAEIMPPVSSNLKKLTQNEVDLIAKWIKQGAKFEKHWSFVPPRLWPLPPVKDKKWPKNEIDYFVLNKLEKYDLSPNPEADRERLLRRVCLDLTGLPPTLQMMDSFLANNSPKAYEKVVDELLKSPAYGEKMALHWLDVARFGDTYGYQNDNYRSQWPWRDWVIHAFNVDLSYDKFVTWQLAGDLMPNATKEQILATAFNRNHKITEEGGIIPEEYRVAYVTDRTNTFGKALLGITLECAHCHDHKYDPFSQKEYYQVFSFFNSVKESFEEQGGSQTYAKKPKMSITNDDVKNVLRFINKPDTDNLIVSVMGDSEVYRKTHILLRGDYNTYGDEVHPGTPKAILPFNDSYPQNRLGLARWLFDTANPLTARVFVNQMWQEIFGRGIVKTSADFGMQGGLPSHLELLDWLSVDFMRHGWDIKRLIRQMVMSATYRQSALMTPEKMKIDPEDVLLSRTSRSRLPAEIIRDVVLESSGLLVHSIGGPSVNPYQPAGLWESAGSSGSTFKDYKQSHGPNLYRRGIYTLVKKTVPPAAFAIFDASNRDQCEVNRSRTNTPLQALVMMNDPTVLEAARVLAAKLLEEKTGLNDKIFKAFRLIINRSPDQQELSILVSYYVQQQKIFDQRKAERVLNVGEYPIPSGMNKVELASMMEVVDAIYNLEEAITKS